MKRYFKNAIALAVVLLLGAMGSQSVNAITLGYSSLSGDTISFAGNSTFSFQPSGYQASITLSDGAGDSIGNLVGMSGTYAIGTVSSPAAGIQTAFVTGSGTLTVEDINGSLLTATLRWEDITSIGTQDGLNLNGVANLSSVNYSGTESDLVALANGTSPEDTLDFSFNTPRNVTYLKTHAIIDGFSGQLSATPVPDGGLTVAFLGFALVGVEGLRRKLRK